MAQHPFNMRLMSPTTPASSSEDSPPTTPSTDSPSDGSYVPSSSEMSGDSPDSDNHREVAIFRDSVKSPPPVSRLLIHKPWTEEPPALAYVVSLLHTLPFIFRTEMPPTVLEGEFAEPFEPLKLVEASREYALITPHGKVPIPLLVHPLFMRQHRRLVCVALRRLPVTLPLVSMALTLLSAVYPHHYGWNHHVSYPISPTSLIPPTPAIRHPSLTDSFYYQLGDGIVIHKGESQLIYDNKAYIPTRLPSRSEHPTDYLFGWSMGIENYCQLHDHHPDCLDPIQRSFIEREFVASTIDNPSSLAVLEEYLQNVHANTIGHNLQWLLSSSAPVKEDVRNRLELTRLYAQIDNQEGRVFHTKKGLRITIPEEKWIDWKTQTPSSQKDFTQVAWAQLTQFDKEALMAGLREGKIGPRTVYIDFNAHAEHEKFPNTELDTVQQYYIELMAQTSAYRYYNQFVMQELAHGNEPLHLPFTYNWKTNT